MTEVHELPDRVLGDIPVDDLCALVVLLGALDAGEREQLAGLLRKLLLSPPFQELDPAAPRLTTPATIESPPDEA